MIISRTPYRISFFGGGTDYPSWYLNHGGGVLATSINKYCYITCRYLPPFFAHRIRVVYSKIEDVQAYDQIQHPAVRETLRFLQLERGLEIHHDGDLPARSGMGSSSSFTVGLLYALYALMGVMPSKNQLALESIHIEQNMIKETVGSQDQVTAAYGGLNHIFFSTSGDISVRPVTVPRGRLEELSSHLMLFYTGIMRTASDVAKTYLEDIESKSKHLNTLKDMVDEAISILASNRCICHFGELLHQSWMLKRELSPHVSNGVLDDIYERAQQYGAVGGKIAGAGGGGFLLLFVPPSAQERMRKALKDLIYVPFKLESSGSQIIFYEPSQEDYSILDRERTISPILPFREATFPMPPKGNGMTLPKETLQNLYFNMLRIRKFQLRIESHYLDNEMKTPIHLYIGQEAVAVGVCAHLTKEDCINSSHRRHGHYLAKGGNAKALIAELHCKETGCSKGRGGSMHLVDVAVGHYGSSSIVGGGIPIGTGMALAIKMKNKPLVSVVFFGDGAADEGVLYESINFAILKKLPVIYILENNQYSVCSHYLARQAGDNIFHAMSTPLLFTKKIDGNDVLAVYETARHAVDRARSGLGPSFIECLTYRIRGHAGCESQDFKGYRKSEEVEEWKARCPVLSFEKKLMDSGVMTSGEIETMEKRIDAELDEAFTCARNDPLPEAKDLHLYLFCELEKCPGQK